MLHYERFLQPAVPGHTPRWVLVSAQTPIKIVAWLIPPLGSDPLSPYTYVHTQGSRFDPAVVLLATWLSHCPSMSLYLPLGCNDLKARDFAFPECGICRSSIQCFEWGTAFSWGKEFYNFWVNQWISEGLSCGKVIVKQGNRDFKEARSTEGPVTRGVQKKTGNSQGLWNPFPLPLLNLSPLKPVTASYPSSIPSRRQGRVQCTQWIRHKWMNGWMHEWMIEWTSYLMA